MLCLEKDIVCGIFDSRVAFKKTAVTETREVDCYELELFDENEGVSFVDGVGYPAECGSVICAKPRQKRCSQLPVKCLFIRFYATESEEARLLSQFPTRSLLPPERVDEMCGLFYQICACYISNTDLTQKTLKINRLFYEILYACRKYLLTYSLMDGSPVGGSVTVLKAKEYIDKHYGSDCSLAVIADATGVSPNYLHTIFKAHLGKSPLDYVTEKRIDLSKQKLLSMDLSLLEIALEVGFCSQSYFGKVFREKTGITPAEYRKRYLSEY